jgi:hypothetical protein
MYKQEFHFQEYMAEYAEGFPTFQKTNGGYFNYISARAYRKSAKMECISG